MKTLSIVRHAKAERPEGYPSDFVRPLTPRGHKDATRLGALLAGLEPKVDCILSSPATRAAQTTDRLAAENGVKSRSQIDTGDGHAGVRATGVELSAIDKPLIAVEQERGGSKGLAPGAR